jgi:hypothetical protein
VHRMTLLRSSSEFTLAAPVGPSRLWRSACQRASKPIARIRCGCERGHRRTRPCLAQHALTYRLTLLSGARHAHNRTAASIDSFATARTHNTWLDKPVGDETLRELYNALKWDRPARMLACPFRLSSHAKSKERLRPSLPPATGEDHGGPSNCDRRIRSAFYEKLPKLFPHNPGMRDLFATNPAWSRSPHGATRRCKAPISFSQPVRWGSTPDRCPGSTTPS